MELLIVVGGLIIGFYLGWHLHGAVIIHKTNKILNEIEKKSAEQEAGEMIHIVIEKYDGMFMVYDKKDSRFMAKGSSLEELEDELRSMYPGKRFGATNDNLKEVGFL
jgi:hypothetical protein